MELQLEELKAPVEVHFTDGVPHPTTLQAKDVPIQLGMEKKGGFIGFHLKGDGLHFENGIHHP
jgi:hypothetical protein